MGQTVASIGRSTASTTSAIDGRGGGRHVFAEARERAERRGQPDRAGRRQPFDFLLFVELENRARAEEADAGRDALARRASPPQADRR